LSMWHSRPRLCFVNAFPPETHRVGCAYHPKWKYIMFHSINNPGGNHRDCEVDGVY